MNITMRKESWDIKAECTKCYTADETLLKIKQFFLFSFFITTLKPKQLNFFLEFGVFVQNVNQTHSGYGLVCFPAITV